MSRVCETFNCTPDVARQLDLADVEDIMELRAYEQAYDIDREDKDGTMRERLSEWQREKLWETADLGNRVPEAGDGRNR